MKRHLHSYSHSMNANFDQLRHITSVNLNQHAQRSLLTQITMYHNTPERCFIFRTAHTNQLSDQLARVHPAPHHTTHTHTLLYLFTSMLWTRPSCLVFKTKDTTVMSVTNSCMVTDMTVMPVTLL